MTGDDEATITRRDGTATVSVTVPDGDGRAEVLWRAAARLMREAAEVEAAERAPSPDRIARTSEVAS